MSSFWKKNTLYLKIQIRNVTELVAEHDINLACLYIF
jgi:hypothetical protein